MRNMKVANVAKVLAHAYVAIAFVTDAGQAQADSAKAHVVSLMFAASISGSEVIPFIADGPWKMYRQFSLNCSAQSCNLGIWQFNGETCDGRGKPQTIRDLVNYGEANDGGSAETVIQDVHVSVTDENTLHLKFKDTMLGEQVENHIDMTYRRAGDGGEYDHVDSLSGIVVGEVNSKTFSSKYQWVQRPVMCSIEIFPR